MELSYVTTYNARTLSGRDEWAGTGYSIAQSLKAQSISIDYIGPLQDSIILKSTRKLKRHYCEWFHHKGYQKDPDPWTLKHYSRQISRKLTNSQSDLVFGATSNLIAYLECKQPTIFWADATFANIQNFYPLYSNLHEGVIKEWHQMETLALQKCKLAIYSSNWAANSAINDYGADPSKVKVVPFGANTESSLTFETAKEAIDSRPSDRCKLLFLGVDWIRKGGNVAYQVAKKLNQSGLPTELTIVGSKPLIEEPLPDFVKALGFISKSTSEGKAQIQELILESHFLILPTLADCTPIVICEANSLGVPCLSTSVGGVPTIIRNDINGRLFDKDANISEYCDYITNIFADYSNYRSLALSAFYEYESRLNWKAAGQKVKELLIPLI